MAGSRPGTWIRYPRAKSEHNYSMQIIFKDCEPLDIVLDDTPLAQRWADIVRENYRRDPSPIFRDPQRYTYEYFKQLATKAKHQLGWNWNIQDLSLASTTFMHKDIESFLANGFSSIPEEFDDLLHEIHFCLHAVESGSKRNSWLELRFRNEHTEIILLCIFHDIFTNKMIDGISTKHASSMI